MSLLRGVEFIFATCTNNFGECLVVIFFLGLHLCSGSTSTLITLYSAFLVKY